ncbi:1-aminocyclopropane-1-carboxylate synthase-like protein 1 [Glandiceps talaboti]
MATNNDNEDIHVPVLSQRGQKIAKSAIILDIGFALYQNNKYHQEDNPQGIVNAGTAENVISADLVAARLAKIKTPFENNTDILRYQPFTGLSEFRNTVSSFLTKHAKARQPLDPDNLVILNGCGSCISSLATVLCDAGDAWLIPTPYYTAILSDTGRIPQVQLVHADLTGEMSDGIQEPFQLTVKILEDSLQQAKDKGINVRALFLMNPNNPLGTVYSGELLRDCLNFAHRHQLHIIVDEIYMLSIFEEDTQFISVLSLEDLPDPERTHFIWGFSKDFSMSGLRCGALYSWNKEVVSAMSNISYFFSTPTSLQMLLNSMLLDEEWLTKTYLPTNSQRLKECHTFLSEGLAKLGLTYIVGSGGLYIWVNFTNYISPLTFDAELTLFHDFIAGGVYLPPGQGFFCCEPGWFRIIFALPKDQLQQVLKRIGDVIDGKKGKARK